MNATHSGYRWIGKRQTKAFRNRRMVVWKKDSIGRKKGGEIDCEVRRRIQYICSGTVKWWRRGEACSSDVVSHLHFYVNIMRDPHMCETMDGAARVAGGRYGISLWNMKSCVLGCKKPCLIFLCCTLLRGMKIFLREAKKKNKPHEYLEEDGGILVIRRQSYFGGGGGGGGGRRRVWKTVSVRRWSEPRTVSVPLLAGH